MFMLDSEALQLVADRESFAPGKEFNASAQMEAAYDDHYIFGLIYYTIGEYDKAIPFLRSAIGPSWENNVECPEMLGHCYLQTKQYEKAIEAFITALGNLDAILYNDIQIKLYTALQETFQALGYKNEELMCEKIAERLSTQADDFAQHDQEIKNYKERLWAILNARESFTARAMHHFLRLPDQGPLPNRTRIIALSSIFIISG